MEQNASQRYRQRLKADPERYREARERINERRRKRYAEEAGFRDRAIKQVKESYARRQDSIRVYRKDYFARNREALREHAKALYAKKGAVYNLRSRLRRYGLTEVDWELLVSRDPKCAICQGDGGAKGLAIDHDHKSGRVRGRLCGTCNRLLHKLETMPGWVEAATAYLHRDHWSGSPTWK